jgi:hypothetical protein
MASEVRRVWFKDCLVTLAKSEEDGQWDMDIDGAYQGVWEEWWQAFEAAKKIIGAVLPIR